MFWKNKYRRKYVGKEEEDVEGSRIFFRGWRGRDFWCFFRVVFWGFAEYPAKAKL